MTTCPACGREERPCALESRRASFTRRAVKNTSPFAPRQCRHLDVFSLEQLPEIVRLGVDVHMVAAAPERAVTRSPLQNAVVGTGRRTLDARKALRKEPRVVKTVSSDSYFAGHTASLLFQRSISARHREKMTPDPRSAVCQLNVLFRRADCSFIHDSFINTFIQASG